MNEGKVRAFYLTDHLLERPPSPADLMRRYYRALRELDVSEEEAGSLTANMLWDVVSDLGTEGIFDKLLEGELKDE